MRYLLVLIAIMCVSSLQSQCELLEVSEGIITCTAEFDPVCGCDDRQYGNDCEAEASSISSFYYDECNGSKFPLVIDQILLSSSEPQSYTDRSDQIQRITQGERIYNTIFFTNLSTSIELHFSIESPNGSITDIFSTGTIRSGNEYWWNGNSTPDESGLWNFIIEIEHGDIREMLAKSFFVVEADSQGPSCFEEDFTQEILNNIFCSDSRYQDSRPTLECHFDNNNANAVLARFDYTDNGQDFQDFYDCTGNLISTCGSQCTNGFSGFNYFFCGGLETIEFACAGKFDLPWIEPLACEMYFPNVVIDEFTTGIQVSLWSDGNEEYYSFEPNDERGTDFYDIDGNFISSCFLTTTSGRPQCSPRWNPVFDIIFEDFRVFENCSNEPPVQSCRDRDSLALVALYNSTDGPNWTNTWDLDQPMNTWWGIRTDQEGCVQVIDLDFAPGLDPFFSGGVGNNLNGVIPVEFYNLSMVDTIKISFNPNLAGELLSGIGQLTSLRILALYKNNLSGAIPESIGSLTELRELILRGNNLISSIPESIGNLTQLTDLFLEQNDLSGVLPESIGDLNQLISLTLWENNLSGAIPESIGRMSDLLVLSLRENNLSGAIPESIGNLSELAHLDLRMNNLSGNIPASIGNLTRMSSLDLNSNNLSGNIPESIGNLTGIQIVTLSDNNLSGAIPESIGNLTGMTSLDLSTNNLSSTIPESFGNLVELRSILLDSNSLTGCIPRELSDFCILTETQVFFRCENDFRGCQYDFRNNPGLAWGGDFERFCSGEEQIGAPCDDGDPNTVGDVITENCECRGSTGVGSCNSADFELSVELVRDQVCSPSPEPGEIEVILEGTVGGSYRYVLSERDNVQNTDSLFINQPTRIFIRNNLDYVLTIINTIDNCVLFNRRFNFSSSEQCDVDTPSSCVTGTDFTIESGRNFIAPSCENNFEGSIDYTLIADGDGTPIRILAYEDSVIVSSQIIGLSESLTFPLGPNTIYRFDFIDEVSNCQSSGVSGSFPSGLIINSNIVQRPLCENRAVGGPSGIITVDVTGGIPFPDGTYFYDWGVSGNGPNFVPDRFASGIFEVTITDSMGCSITESFDLTVDPIEVIATPSQSRCVGVNTATVSVEGFGGVNVTGDGYRFFIQGDDLLGNGYQDVIETIVPTGEFLNVPGGTYQVWAEDDDIQSSLCEPRIFEVIVAVEQSYDIAVTPINGLGCTMGENGVDIEVSRADNSEGNDISYEIFLKENGIRQVVQSGGPIGSLIIQECLIEGDYDIEITDQEGCGFLDSFFVSGCSFSIESSIIPPLCDAFDDGEITLSVSSGAAPIMYQWDDGSSDSSRMNLGAGEFTVVISDNSGCEEMLSFSFDEVQVGDTCDDGDANTIDDVITESCECRGEMENEVENPELVMTSYFTPDNDGVNETLRFNENSSIPNSELFIYNRWGKEIFHMNNYDNSWDAEGLPEGVYYYVLQVGEEIHKSSVTVVRD